MSVPPYILPQARQRYRVGNGELADAMMHDRLWDTYGNEQDIHHITVVGRSQ